MVRFLCRNISSPRLLSAESYRYYRYYSPDNSTNIRFHFALITIVLVMNRCLTMVNQFFYTWKRTELNPILSLAVRARFLSLKNVDDSPAPATAS